MKRILAIASLCLICALSTIGFAACDGAGESAENTENSEILTVYNTYVAYAEENGVTPLSYEVWLKTIKGEKGDQGIQGANGKDGIDGKDGKDGTNGQDGKSAYQIWLDNGNTGSETDFLTWLKGADGTNGKDGVDGKDGKDGTNGQDGKSAYQIWLDNGNTGSEADFLSWLKGIDGTNGKDGETPTIEISADGYWVINGTKTDYKAIGVDGKDGKDGQNGKDGVGVSSVTINDKGELIITLTDGSTVNAGKVKDVHPHEIIEKEIEEKEATCTSCGIKYVFCSVCGELLRTVITDKAPHAFKDEIVAPTCTESGYTTHTCTVCGYKTTDTIVEPTGHSYKNEYVFDDVCHYQETICGHTDAIQKENHKLNDNGVCTVCGYDNSVTLALKYVEINDGKEYAVDELTNENVKVVYIPETYNNKPVTKINDMVFYGNTNLEKVIIGDNVTDIGASAFYNCSNLKTVKLPEKLTEIKDTAFSYCSSLTSIEIPDSVTSIGYVAFYCCSSLTSIEIPDSVTSIGDGAFYNCRSLTSIEIPDSVTSIGDYAFDGCSSLQYNEYDNRYYLGNKNNPYIILIKTKTQDITACTIHSKTKVILNEAFYNCSRLRSIVIPDSVTSIGERAFNRCSSLTSIEVDSNNLYYKSIEGNLYSKDGTMLIQYAIGKTATEFIIPESVTSIGGGAFEGCSSLEAVTIGNSVTSIGNHAFYDCRSLTSVEIPDSVKSIGDWAFCECSSLTSIEIPDSVTSIGDGAFYNCRSLTSIEIPDSVTSIGAYAFSNCSSLTSVVIPDSVTSIGYWAFSYCSSLTSMEIPDSVMSIGERAFNRCSSLTSIEVDSNNLYYKSIEGNLYSKDGTMLIQYAIGKTATEFIIPESVTSIGGDAFSGCPCVKTNKGLSYVDKWLIGADSAITSATIKEDTVGIADGAFADCSSLTSITFNGTKEEWNAISKGYDWKYSVPTNCVVHCTNGDVAI